MNRTIKIFFLIANMPLIFLCLIISSCNKQNRLKKNFDIHNNKKIISLELNDNGEFTHLVEVTNLVKKKRLKPKFRKAKLRELKFIRDTIVYKGTWEMREDTILVHAKIRYNQKAKFDNPKFYKIEISESYQENIDKPTFKIIDEDGNPKMAFAIKTHKTYLKEDYEKTKDISTLSQTLTRIKVIRYGIFQYFDDYRLKSLESNSFTIKVIETNDRNEINNLKGIWTKYFLLKDNLAIPGSYYIRSNDKSIVPEHILKGFDHSKAFQIKM